MGKSIELGGACRGIKSWLNESSKWEAIYVCLQKGWEHWIYYEYWKWKRESQLEVQMWFNIWNKLVKDVSEGNAEKKKEMKGKGKVSNWIIDINCV